MSKLQLAEFGAFFDTGEIIRCAGLQCKVGLGGITVLRRHRGTIEFCDGFSTVFFAVLLSHTSVC